MATAAVLVWRVAHHTLTVTTPTGTVPAGPYTAPVVDLLDQYGDEDAVYELLGMRDVHGQDMHHLAPDQDPGLGRIEAGEVCGFDSPAALRAWFGDYMDVLHAAGFTVRCYRVPAVRRGALGQVAFRWAAAREHSAPTDRPTTTTPKEGTR